MAKCDFCGSTIILGGTKEGEKRYCNAQCHQKGQLLAIAEQMPLDQVKQLVQQVHQGLCPKCQGSGPVDVHTSYRVWSALVMTRWSSRPQISCRACGNKSKLADAAFSLVLGWWGFPWGFLLTPVQIVRNLAGLASASPDPYQPSPQLEKVLKLNLAAQAVQQQQAAAGSSQ